MRGRPPKPPSHQVKRVLLSSQWQSIREEAEKRGIEPAALVRFIVAEWLAEQAKERNETPFS